MARAYQLGIEEGLLEAQVGRGTYIRAPKPARGTVFGETHVDPHIVDLRNAAVPDFGQDGIFDQLSEKVTFGGVHSMVCFAGHNEMETRAKIIGVPSDVDGMTPKTSDELFRRDRPQILHVSANIHNPTTHIMSKHRAIWRQGFAAVFCCVHPIKARLAAMSCKR